MHTGGNQSHRFPGMKADINTQFAAPGGRNYPFCYRFLVSHRLERFDLPSPRTAPRTCRTFSVTFEHRSIPWIESDYPRSPAGLAKKCLVTSCLRGCTRLVRSACILFAHCTLVAFRRRKNAEAIHYGRPGVAVTALASSRSADPGRTRSDPLRRALGAGRHGLVAEELSDLGKPVDLVASPLGMPRTVLSSPCGLGAHDFGADNRQRRSASVRSRTR